MTSHEETWTVVRDKPSGRVWENGNQWSRARYVGTGVGRQRYDAASFPLGTVLRIVTRVEVVEP